MFCSPSNNLENHTWPKHECRYRTAYTDWVSRHGISNEIMWIFHLSLMIWKFRIDLHLSRLGLYITICDDTLTEQDSFSDKNLVFMLMSYNLPYAFHDCNLSLKIKFSFLKFLPVNYKIWTVFGNCTENWIFKLNPNNEKKSPIHFLFIY